MSPNMVEIEGFARLPPLLRAPLSPAQCRAARGLLDWTQERLAEAAGISRSTVRDFECGRRELHRSTADLIVAAFGAAGAVLLPEGDGVRLAP